MEEYLKNNFELEPKNPSEEALTRWRSAVWLVKNPRRRFRMVADLAKRAEADRKRKKIQVIGSNLVHHQYYCMAIFSFKRSKFIETHLFKYL